METSTSFKFHLVLTAALYVILTISETMTHNDLTHYLAT